MIDATKVTQIVASCADAHLVPYFNKLSDAQIREKSAGDFVTQADIEMEENLIEQLKQEFSGVACIGEESFDPSNQEILKSSALFVIDPLDGTAAFRRGDQGFATLVVFLVNGQIEQAWLHAPLLKTTVYAEKNKGVFLNGVKIEQKKVQDLTAQIGAGHFQANHKPEMQAMSERLRNKGFNLGSHTHACMDFLRFVTGEIDYIVYQNCYPWDVLSGVLITHELGGHAALLHEGGDLMLRPFEDINRPVLFARSKEDWSVLKEILLS